MEGPWKWLLQKCARKLKMWSCRTGVERCLWLPKNVMCWNHLFLPSSWTPRHIEGQCWHGSENACSAAEAVLGSVFWGEFWVSWNRCRNISLKNCNRWWNVDLSLGSWNKMEKQTVETCGSHTPKMFLTQPSASKIMVTGFLEFWRNLSVGLPATKVIRHWRCLCCCASEFTRPSRENKESDKGHSASSWQCFCM